MPSETSAGVRGIRRTAHRSAAGEVRRIERGRVIGLIERQPIVFDDPDTGRETLRRMASVDHYNSWIYRRIRPYLGRRILEVGCGLGNMTGYFLDAELVVSIDRLRESVALVQDQYRHLSNVEALEGDICDPALLPRLRSRSLDTAVCINVLEHVEDDVGALRMMARAVEPNGRVVVLAPAGRRLYGSLDVGLGHYRRYDLPELRRKVESTGCKVEDAFYMNVAGIPGWFLNSRVLKRALLPRRMLGLFNLLAPLFDAAERVLRPPLGLSAVEVGRVPGAKTFDTKRGCASARERRETEA